MKLLKRLGPHNEKAILYNISSIVIPLLLFEEKSSRQREKWEGGGTLEMTEIKPSRTKRKSLLSLPYSRCFRPRYISTNSTFILHTAVR